MRDFEAQYTEMAAEDMEAHVQQLGTSISLSPTQGRTAEEIERMFDYLHGLSQTGQHEAAAKGFTALREIIDDFREREGETAVALEFFFEWSMLAVKVSPESRSTFACMPIYLEMLDTFDEGPEETRYRGVLARGQFLRHIEFWLGRHGSLDVLSEDDRRFIAEVRDQYPDLHEAAVDAAIDREAYEAVVRLFRNGAQAFLLLKRPNDAIRCLKEAIEYLPDTPGFHPSSQADLLMQLGQVFIGYNKLEVALKYFEQAREIYEEAGEDHEMQAYQAEGWIEDVRKRMKR